MSHTIIQYDNTWLKYLFFNVCLFLHAYILFRIDVVIHIEFYNSIHHSLNYNFDFQVESRFNNYDLDHLGCCNWQMQLQFCPIFILTQLLEKLCYAGEC